MQNNNQSRYTVKQFYIIELLFENTQRIMFSILTIQKSWNCLLLLHLYVL